MLQRGFGLFGVVSMTGTALAFCRCCVERSRLSQREALEAVRAYREQQAAAQREKLTTLPLTQGRQLRIRTVFGQSA